MKKLLLKSTLFLVGILAVAVALAFLPFDTFTFRSWESLLWGTDLRPTIGKFYPNKTVLRTESGDLGHGSKYQVLKKDVLWKTDAFGFRNDPEHIQNCSIVLVGDSHVVGTGTSQEFILSEQLRRKLNVPVFNYSPMLIDAAFIHNLAAMGIKPKMVISEAGGSTSDTAPAGRRREALRAIQAAVRRVLCSEPFLWLEIALDRFWKREPLRYLQSRIDSAAGVFAMPVIVGNDNMLFMKEALAGIPPKDAAVKENADAIQTLSSTFKKFGIDFIFIPMPDKESVYREWLPPEFKAVSGDQDYCTRLKRELDLRGVRSVDLYSSFREKALAGETLYYLDDKHWNNKGIEIASDLIVSEIINGTPHQVTTY